MDGGAWCRLQSMGSQRVGHDWATSLSPSSIWDLSFLTRGWTHIHWVGRWSLNHWTAREKSLMQQFDEAHGVNLLLLELLAHTWFDSLASLIAHTAETSDGLTDLTPKNQTGPSHCSVAGRLPGAALFPRLGTAAFRWLWGWAARPSCDSAGTAAPGWPCFRRPADPLCHCHAAQIACRLWNLVNI